MNVYFTRDPHCNASRPEFVQVAVRIAASSLAFAVCLPVLTAQTPMEVLSQFAGKSVLDNRISDPMRDRLLSLVGEVPKGFLIPPYPWKVWKTERSGATRYVVLLAEDIVMIPGGSSACIVLYDDAGQSLGRRCFQTGWRLTPADAELVYSEDTGQELVRLKIARYINGKDIGNEYFAIRNGAIHLVRLESTGGSAAQNEYVFDNMEIGFAPSAATNDEWVRLLESSDLAVVSSALVFLGGRHISEEGRRFGQSPQESRYAPLFRRLLSDERVRGEINRLTYSGNRWVREAATLAARGPEDRHY